MTAAPLLEVRDLHVHYPIHGGIFLRKVGEVKAVGAVAKREVEFRTSGGTARPLP